MNKKMIKILPYKKNILLLRAKIPAMPLNDAHFGRFSIFCICHKVLKLTQMYV